MSQSCASILGDAASSPANRVFVTSTPYDGSLGGLAGANAMCASSATAAERDGTYVAWLSSGTVSAIDQLAGSRGWVAVDGTPIADLADDLVTGRMLGPIILDEWGTKRVAHAWTGTNSNGHASLLTCGDWNTNATGVMGSSGWGAGGAPIFTASGDTLPCNLKQPIYCFEVGHAVQVEPIAIAGRQAFVAKAKYAGGGVAALDATCASEATQAGLQGSFRAAVATTTATIASHFSVDARPWRRIDGTAVTSVGSEMFDGSDLRSFVTQHADGTYVVDASIITGSASATTTGTAASTCNNWTSTSGGSATIGNASVISAATFWGGGMSSCDIQHQWLCLEE